MRRHTLPAAFAVLSLSIHPTDSEAKGLCEPLRKFAESVKPNESKVLEFHTSWGSGFKDSDDKLTLSAKRCDHKGYEPAKAVCEYFMEHGATEFAGNNAKDAVMCLSERTRFADRMQLDGIELSLTYGTKERGSNVDIRYSPDGHLGGMILSITARGY
jgi:hypothetical protein